MKPPRLLRSLFPKIACGRTLLGAAGKICERLEKVIGQLTVLQQQGIIVSPPESAKEQHLARAHREAAWLHWRCLHPMSLSARVPRAGREGGAGEVEELERAVRERFGCSCRYGGWARVRQLSEGDLLWEGLVQIFYLRGSSEAERCYAWIGEEDGQREIMIVPNSYLITSAEAAVHSIIGQG